jgi:hypothetical protein
MSTATLHPYCLSHPADHHSAIPAPGYKARMTPKLSPSSKLRVPLREAAQADAFLLDARICKV